MESRLILLDPDALVVVILGPLVVDIRLEEAAICKAVLPRRAPGTGALLPPRLRILPRGIGLSAILAFFRTPLL